MKTNAQEQEVIFFEVEAEDFEAENLLEQDESETIERDSENIMIMTV
jgi:hypothetical protein